MTAFSLATATASRSILDRDDRLGPCRRSRSDTAPKLMARFDTARRPPGRAGLPADRRALPVADDYAPDAVAARCGIPRRHHQAHRRRTRRQRLSTRRSSSMCRGRIVPAGAMTKMIGRPVSMHAMRGISAHSNGFQTCRTPPSPADHSRHHRCAGRLSLQAALSQSPVRRRSSPPASRAQVKPNTPLPGPPLGFVDRAPRICWSMPTAGPAASTRPIPGKRRFAAHGLMHTVIANAAKRRSLSDRRALPLHGQHELELGDECAEHARRPHRRRTRRRRHTSSRTSSIPMPIARRWCLRRSHPARHHLSRALGLHFAARPADLRSRRPGRFHPPAGGRAGSRCAGRSRPYCSIWAHGSAFPA